MKDKKGNELHVGDKVTVFGRQYKIVSIDGQTAQVEQLKGIGKGSIAIAYPDEIQKIPT